MDRTRIAQCSSHPCASTITNSALPIESFPVSVLKLAVALVSRFFPWAFFAFELSLGQVSTLSCVVVLYCM